MKNLTNKKLYGFIHKMILLFSMLLLMPVLPIIGIGALQGMLGNVLGKKATGAPAKRGYFRNMVIEDGDDAYDTIAEIIALPPIVGIRLRIWEFTVPAQMALCWGYGSPAFPDNQGYIQFCIMLAGTGFDVGLVTLAHENHTRHNYVVVDEFNDVFGHTADSTTVITARNNDKAVLRPLPEKSDIPLVGQDSRLVIDYLPIALVAETGGYFSIPATVYD
jgi:hypothetical protein